LRRSGAASRSKGQKREKQFFLSTMTQVYATAPQYLLIV
jgi:hypothetical protein